MIFAINVLSPPHADSSYRALKFASALIEQGYELSQVFFYQDGVFNGNQLAAPPQDEICMAKEWFVLQQKSSTRLYLCIASGIRRGIISENEAQRQNLNNFNLADGFEIVGLGQLLDASKHSDRVVTFG